MSSLSTCKGLILQGLGNSMQDAQKLAGISGCLHFCKHAGNDVGKHEERKCFAKSRGTVKRPVWRDSLFGRPPTLLCDNRKCDCRYAADIGVLLSEAGVAPVYWPSARRT